MGTYRRKGMKTMRFTEEDAQRQEEWELRLLERFSRASKTHVTAELLGAGPLKDRMPDTFKELAQQYGGLMDRALEQRAYKVEHRVSEGLRCLAEELGFVKAGPRDVVEMYTTALRKRSANATVEKLRAHAEEGRLMVLELMGYLVSYYRNYALGVQTSRTGKSHQVARTSGPARGTTR